MSATLSGPSPFAVQPSAGLASFAIQAPATAPSAVASLPPPPLPPPPAAVLPTPTLAEVNATQPTGGPPNITAAAALNPDPVVQQLLSTVRANHRLEATLRVLSAQLSSERVVGSHALFA
jgi:hypothetical protein